MTGGGNSATLYFSASNSTSSTGTGVASSTGAKSVTIDCSSLNLNTGYITTSAGVRIWDVEVTYSTTSQSSAPTIDDGAAASEFTFSKDVTITATEGATIYYTTDGTDPTKNSSTYSSPIHITKTTTIKAAALEEGKELSSVSSKTFTKVLADNTITVTGGTTHNIALTGAEAVEEYTLSATATNGTVSFALKSATNLTEGTDFDFENGEFVFYETYKGIIVVTASVAADDDYAAASKDITINVEGDKRTPVIAYDGDDAEISNTGALVIDPELIETDGTITITSSNTDVATVSEYTISAVDDGTSTITITTAEGTYYNAGSGSFELTVVTPTACDLALTGAPVAKTFDVYNNATPQVITYTTSSTGEVSIASSPYATFDIDQVNKKITVTPKSATPSTQTITINQAAEGRYLAGSTTFSLTVTNSATTYSFEKVTSTSNLEAGDLVTFVYETNRALGAAQTNNYNAAAVAISDGAFSLSASQTAVTLLTLEATTAKVGSETVDAWYFNTGSDYLYAASSSSNYMKHADLATADNNAKATISFSEGNAVVTFRGSYTHNIVRYNSSSSLFSCYTSGQNDIQLYKRSKYDNVITVTNGTDQTLNLNSETELTLSATSYCGAVSFAVKSATGLTENTDFTFDTETGELLVDEEAVSGTITITASTTETATHKAASVDIVVSVVGKPAAPDFSISNQEKLAGSTITLVNGVDFTTDGTVTLSTSNAAVASVDGLTVTAEAVGTATITVTAAAGTLYTAGSTTFNITVTAPEGRTTVSNNVLFNETFANCKGTGGNKTGAFDNGSQNGSVEEKTDETYSTITNAYPANGCARLGTGSENGVLTTTVSITGNATLTFSGAGWSGSDTNTIKVTATGATLSGDTDVTLTNAVWNDYIVNISGATGSVVITFTEKRGFLDDIKITQTPSTTVTLNKYGYATFCSENPMDFSSTEGYTAWRVNDIEGSTVTFTKITEAIKGGQGVLLYNKDADGESTSNVTVNFANGTTKFDAKENLLVGTLAPTYVTAGEYYGLSGQNFVRVAESTVPAHKALLPASALGGGSVKAFNFVFEDNATGIRTVETVSPEEAAQIFDLSGRRLNKMQKGINIVNGKKVLY